MTPTARAAAGFRSLLGDTPPPELVNRFAQNPDLRAVTLTRLSKVMPAALSCASRFCRRAGSILPVRISCNAPGICLLFYTLAVGRRICLPPMRALPIFPEGRWAFLLTIGQSS